MCALTGGLQWQDLGNGKAIFFCDDSGKCNCAASEVKFFSLIKQDLYLLAIVLTLAEV
jgi:hypothetical protein